jgi:hypothetical protein
MLLWFSWCLPGVLALVLTFALCPDVRQVYSDLPLWMSVAWVIFLLLYPHLVVWLLDGVEWCSKRLRGRSELD